MQAVGRSSTFVLLLVLVSALGCGGKAQTGSKQGANGGQGGGSHGGSGGKGSGGVVPGPATHVSECEALCARTLDAGCIRGSDECVLACATVTGFSGCQSQIDAWLGCAQIAEVVCDESGSPTFVACDQQLALAAACAATTAPPKMIQQSCENYCAQVEEAGCDTTNPLGDCSQACGLAGMVVADCQTKFVNYLECLVASGASCDANGQLNASICMSQQFAYTGCMLSTIGESTELNGLGGSGGT